MAEFEQQEQFREPTIEALHKLQGILTRKLNREVSLEETKTAYHHLMGFAFALVELSPNESVEFLKQPLEILPP